MSGSTKIAEPQSTATSNVSYGPVTVRSVLLGLIGAGLAAAFEVVTSLDPNRVMLPLGNVFTLMTGPIFWLFLLAIANLLLRRRFPKAVLRPSEFAMVYGISTVAASIAEHDQVQFLIPMFTYPFRATRMLDVSSFRQYLPSWFVPRNPGVIEPYYAGHTTFWQPELLRAWLIPLLSWLAFLMAVAVTMWAWNVILRRRWVEDDHLSFPCVQLPLHLCREAGFGGMVGGKIFWYGMLTAALLVSLERLHNFFPNTPNVVLGYEATPVLQNLPFPWNALAPMFLYWDTFQIGICYLIPTDILFSSWFFYVLRKLVEVLGYAHGWRAGGGGAPGFPYVPSQAAGAWAGLFFLLVWAERRHLLNVLKSAFGRGVPLDDAREPGAYRWAGRFLIVGTAFQILFLLAAGMSLLLSVIYTAFFWILTVTMTRIYAQVGPPMQEIYFLNPQSALPNILGTAGEPPGSLALFSTMYWFNRGYKGQPMAHMLSAFYIAGETRTKPRVLGKWVLVAFLLGCVVCLLTYLHWAYRIGEDQFFSSNGPEVGAYPAVLRFNQWYYQPKGPNWTEIGAMAYGALVTLLLAKMSYIFIGNPFHPVGYALAISYAVEYNWPVFLVIWLLKSLLLRYGGGGLYQRFVPFFLGLTLSGLVTPIFWGFCSWLFEWYKA